MERKKITLTDLQRKKANGQKITMLTAYDYPTARLVDEAGVDMILVGDSLGMVVLGYDSTLPVTMDEMIHHAKAVRRGTTYAFLVVDMPFLSFQVSEEDAIRNAGRLMKEAGCDAVKLESAEPRVLRFARAIVEAGIPVLGHIGLTPQSASKLGGFTVQGKDAAAAARIMDSAAALEAAGSFGVVLECVPGPLSAQITGLLKIPTIGIGAGKECDGQVLVLHDLLGLFDRFTPKFAKRYVDLSAGIREALQQYRGEVESGAFPGPEHTFTMSEAELKKLGGCCEHHRG